MATILYSSIVNGDSVAFDPATDILSFDTNAINSTAVGLSDASDYIGIGISASGKTFSLPATVSLAQLTTSNVVFADGSRVIIGDNTTGTTNDGLANTLTGTNFNDQLLGLAGNHRLGGGSGNDTMIFGAGAAAQFAVIGTNLAMTAAEVTVT